MNNVSSELYLDVWAAHYHVAYELRLISVCITYAKHVKNFENDEKKKEQKPIMLVFPLVDDNIPQPKTISEDNVLNSLVSADELFVSEEEISSNSSGHSSSSLTKK